MRLTVGLLSDMFNGDNEVACSLHRIRQFQFGLLKLETFSMLWVANEFDEPEWVFRDPLYQALITSTMLPLHNLASLFKLSIHGPAESSLHFSYQSRVWLMSYLIFSEKELFIFSSRAMLVCSAIQILWTSCCYTFLTVNLSCQKYKCWTWFKENLCMKEPVC